MPSTGNPWRCKTDCTGGNPSDVQDDQKLHKKKAKVPILQHDANRHHRQVKAYPVSASL